MSFLKNLPKVDGPITTAIRQAIRLRRELLDDGLPADQADAIVGQGLKAVLGNPRQEPWKFVCDRCKDSGWITVDPSPDEMARLIRLYGPNPQYQDYLMRCEPCRYLTQERDKRRHQHGQDEDDGLVAAGRTVRRTRFSR